MWVIQCFASETPRQPVPSPAQQRRAVPLSSSPLLLHLFLQRRLLRIVSADGIPSALPCHNFYELMPAKISPADNVVFTDPEVLARWPLEARFVTAEAAEKHGGCIMFPLLSAPNGKPPFQLSISVLLAPSMRCKGELRTFLDPVPTRRARLKGCKLALTVTAAGDSCTEVREDASGVSNCPTETPLSNRSLLSCEKCMPWKTGPAFFRSFFFSRSRSETTT